MPKHQFTTEIPTQAAVAAFVGHLSSVGAQLRAVVRIIGTERYSVVYLSEGRIPCEEKS